MKATFNVVVERDPDGYLIASVPELPGCHTQAASLDALEERVIEAIILCVEEQGRRPKDEIQEYYGNLRVTVPA